MYLLSGYFTRFIFPISLFVMGSIACGGSYLRGGDHPEFEEEALSTKLDRTDLEKLFKETINHLLKSGVSKRWKNAQRDGREATVAILPVVNETTEHIESSLQTLLKKLETRLINRGDVTVISRVDQPQLLNELRVQQGCR